MLCQQVESSQTATNKMILRHRRNNFHFPCSILVLVLSLYKYTYSHSCQDTFAGFETITANLLFPV